MEEATKESVAESTEEVILFSAEVRVADGEYTLIISDHRTKEAEVYAVPEKAVKKLPFYFSMLRSKLS